jgi:uncharacterized repeat protein (TIGR03803 family)
MIKLNHSRNLAACVRAGCSLAVLMVGGLLPASAPAQTFTTLYSFTASSTNSSGVNTNSDGANPEGVLILTNNTLYGTASVGGSGGNGTVFAVNTESTGFTTLHRFSAALYPQTNSDGAIPQAGLLLLGGTVYGTASFGGTNGSGTVFAIYTNGSGFTNLHNFTATSYTNSDGAYPRAGLISSGNTLYGTASAGGTNGSGTVFAVNTDGTGFKVIYTFMANTDGSAPQAGLILSGSTLYGTAYDGGGFNNGTVFKVNTDGTGFLNLHSFTATSGSYPGPFTNTDGASPSAGLILMGNTLYGTANQGGRSGYGTVFAVNTDGTGFTNLHNFAAGSGSFPNITNNDGAYPDGDLILAGNTLYGTTVEGGSSGLGTVFAVNTDGSGFTSFHSFTGKDGAAPGAGLILAGNTLYGTTFYGGSSGDGTVFSLSFPPQLTIIPSGTNVILTWPTNYAGFDYTGYTLETTTNLDSAAVWTNVVPGPVVVNGQNAVTNPISGSQMFFRLARDQNFGSDWPRLEHAMAAAGASSYGRQSVMTSSEFPSQWAYDIFYLPVPTYVTELCNANPTLCIAAISGSFGPAPGYGCANQWEGTVGSQYVGSSVLVIVPSGGPAGCGGVGVWPGHF